MDLKRLAQNARTSERNRRRIERTGLTPNGHRVWRRPEPENLETSYPNYRAALVLNTERTLPAHYSKAGRMGITTPVRRWSDAEISYVRHNFSTLTKADLMAALPGRPWSSICRRGWSMGGSRPKPKFKLTGEPIIDQVLARAHLKGLTLVVLDEIAGRRGFFSRRRWRHNKKWIAIVARVVRELGGLLRARWPAAS